MPLLVWLSYGALQVRYAAMDRVRVMDEPPASLYEPLVAEQRLTRAEYDAWVRDELLEDAVHSEAVGWGGGLGPSHRSTEQTYFCSLLPALLAFPRGCCFLAVCSYS